MRYQKKIAGQNGYTEWTGKRLKDVQQDIKIALKAEQDKEIAKMGNGQS